MEHGFLERSFEHGGTTRHYVVYVPREYDGKHDFPTILFMHGYGESGTDGLKQLWHGPGRDLLMHRDRWPFLIVFPQKNVFEPLWTTQIAYLDEVLQHVDKEFKVDPHRRYLTGLSQGGHGTMNLAKKLKWQFAAIAPVCGWTENPPEAANWLKDVPMWAFHGGKDNVVDPKGSKNLVDALQTLGARPKLTIYPDDNHDSWTHAYGEEELPKWFLAHELT